MTTTANLGIQVDAKGAEKADKVLKDLGDSAEKTTRRTKRLTGATTQASTATNKLAKDTSNLQRQVSGLATAYLGLATAQRAVTTAADFGEAAQTVRAIGEAAKATEADLASLRNQSRQLGAETRFTATQAAEAQVNLLRAGLQANEVLLASANVLNLATAAQLELSRAAEITAITLKQFGISATESERVTDVLVATSNSAATTVEQLADGLKFAGPVAAGFGASLEEVSAAMGVLSNAGLQATLAGTGLRGVFAVLSRPTDRATRRIELLAKASGQLVEDFDITRRSLREVFEAFQEAQAGPEDLLQIFGRLQAPAALALTRGAQELERFEDRLSGVTGEAQTTADTINDSLRGDILALQSALQELILSVDEGVGPSFRGFVQFLTEVSRALAADTDAFTKYSTAAKLAANAIKFLTVVGAGFVALKFASAIGAATQAIIAMVVSLRALRAAIASTGIGLLVVALGTAGAFALEASGAFDDAADDIDALRGTQRRLANEERARAAERAAEQAKARALHQQDLQQLDQLAKAERDANKQREQSASRAAAAAKQRRAELERTQQKLDEVIPQLERQVELAGFDDATRKRAEEEQKLLDLIAKRLELDVAPGQDFFEALSDQTTAATLDAVETEILDFLDAVSLLQDQLAERIEFRELAEDAGDAFVRIGQAAAETERHLAALTRTGGDRTAVEVATEFRKEMELIRENAERGLAAGTLLPEDFVATLFQAEAQLARIAELRALAPTIEGGNEAVAIMRELSMSADFTAASFEQFEDAATAAIEGYRAQMQLAGADTEALEQSIASVQLQVQAFASEVSRQDFLKDVQSSVEGLTRSFFDLFETLVTGSEDASVAVARFIQSVTKALFQKFVVERTIQAISSAFSGAAGGGGGSAPVASAQGNVFRSGQVQAFQRGGIIGGPTLFPLGLAGEAGPEAILPLSRGRNGNLGVQVNDQRPRAERRNPFVNQSVSPGASAAPTAGELRTGTSRTTNVQMNIRTPDAGSFRRSSRQLSQLALRSASLGV